MQRILVVFLVPILLAADKPATKEERIKKARADLQSSVVATRLQAIGALVHSDISETLSSEMQALLKDADGKVREVAATAIGNHGVLAVPAVPDLLKQLASDPVKEARETAARALGRIGKAVPTERRALEPLRHAADKDADPVTRTVALGALAQMDEDVPGQIAALRKYLHHEEALVRMKASHALGMIGLPAKAAAPEIVDVLKRETDAHRRGYVARALGNTGDPASLPALYEALKNETDGGSMGEMRGAITRLGGTVPAKK